MKVGYQGENGTFSEIAVNKYFNSEITKCNYSNFKSIVNDVLDGTLDYALLPIENSTTGIIAKTYELLKSNDVFVVGEVYVRISENLIVVDGTTIDDIKEVYSHPEALSQCASLFEKYPNMKSVSYQDTAKSVEFISKQNDKSKAALASYLAAEYYGCKILLSDVNDEKYNTTRFFVIQKKVECSKEADKISLYFVVRHEPGALFKVIEVLQKSNINMLKLESRPLKGKLFEYCFIMDFNGNINTTISQDILKSINDYCLEMKILGCYKMANLEEIK